MADFPLPKVVAAKPNGDWRDPERPAYAAQVADLEPEPSIPALPETALADKLRQIAMLIRSLPAEELWTLCEGMRRPEMDKVLIAWAKWYMDPETNEQPQPQERRA